ncbi:MAG: hypothetical protein ACI9C1_001814 [Candidatus Aldehydirespiratoraceae bacterium]|jgi:hypothetical protein
MTLGTRSFTHGLHDLGQGIEQVPAAVITSLAAAEEMAHEIPETMDVLPRAAPKLGVMGEFFTSL